jgi:hypothetical protein
VGSAAARLDVLPVDLRGFKLWSTPTASAFSPESRAERRRLGWSSWSVGGGCSLRRFEVVDLEERAGAGAASATGSSATGSAILGWVFFFDRVREKVKPSSSSSYAGNQYISR